MPSPATTAGGTAATQETSEKQAPLAAVPFIRASQLHREYGNVDKTFTPGGSDTDLGVFDLPAYGYLGEVVLLVEATGGAGTSVAGKENAPWNIIKNIYLEEPNGAVIHQFKSGYSLYLANKYGGYRYNRDPKLDPAYSAIAGATGNFTFVLRIPVALRRRDALGALPNQNSSAQFKLRVTGAKSSDVYSTAPTTMPSVRVRARIQAWDQPSDSAQGRLNMVTPPAVNTTQYWSEQEYQVGTGQNSIQLKRMGNYIRNLIFVFKSSDTGTRTDGDASFPDPASFYYDARMLDQVTRLEWLSQIGERYGLETGTAETAGKRDYGVWPYDFCHEFDGRVGAENNDLWLETLTSTRFEIQGEFAEAGTLTVLTNDVSVAGNVFM